jgi:hypothetical protein
MKFQKKHWIIVVYLLILVACKEETPQESTVVKPTEIAQTYTAQLETDTTTVLINSDTLTDKIDLGYDDKTLAGFQTLNAKFLYFQLGDASHYMFVDKNGNHWDFTDCSVPGYNFERTLPEKEINSNNQGWGSVKETQGLWFKLYIEQDERQLYIDGPIGFISLVRTGYLIDPLTIDIQTELELNFTTQKKAISGYEYVGKESSDGKTTLETKDLDHDLYSIRVRGEFAYYDLDAPPLSSLDFYWSKADEYVVLNNTDLYSYSGTNDITVFHIKSGLIATISKESIIQGVDVGERDMLNIKSISWLDDNTFMIESYMSYLGTSGHPGIDQNRQVKLGDNFANTTNIVTLPTLKISITNDRKLPLYPLYDY